MNTTTNKREKSQKVWLLCGMAITVEFPTKKRLEQFRKEISGIVDASFDWDAYPPPEAPAHYACQTEFLYKQAAEHYGFAYDIRPGYTL